MNFRLKKILIIVASTTILAGCGTPAIINQVQDRQISDLDINTSEHSKPIQLKKVVVKLKRGEHVGAVQGGVLCISQGDLTWKGGRLSIDSDELTETFKNELEKYSFKTVGDTSALFDDPTTWKSEILVAGLIKELKANICFPYIGFGNFSSSKGEAFIKVNWQIYSKLDRAVVLSVDTEGSSKTTSPGPGGTESLILDAFSQAARNLLADEGFRSIVMQGGKSVKETVFKTANGIKAVAGRASPIGSKASNWDQGVFTIYAGGGHGSGFAISENIIITNHHVVGESNSVTIKLESGFETTGKVIAYNSGNDVAAIQITGSLPKYFRISKATPAVGSEVYAIGSPLSDKFNNSVTKGIVSAYRELDGHPFIQADVTIQPGNSGGPLINKGGEVIGIATSGIRIGNASQGINFFVPIDEALKAMDIMY